MKDESGLFVIMALSWPGHGLLGRGRSWWPMITNNNNKSTVQKNGRNIKVVLVITIFMFKHH